MASGYINSVGINASSEGILGGQNGTAIYAALVSPSGTPTVIATGIANGAINSVAINDLGQGIIGGLDFSGAQPPYAAVVSPSGTPTVIVIGVTTGSITSVGINASSQGIIGGQDGSAAYAALVSPAGTPTVIATGVTNGIIGSVGINTSGQGIIGGQDGSAAYAALVSPAGTPTVIATGVTSGFINSVAINDFGQGIIGGKNSSAAYAAIVSPSGIATPINLNVSNGVINSVAINNLLPLLSNIPTGSLSGNNLIFANYINENAPQDAFYFVPAIFDGTLADALESAAPTRNAIALYTADNNLFYLSHSLCNHLRNGYHFRNRGSPQTTLALGPTGLKTDELTASLKNEVKKAPLAEQNRPYTLWFEGIGALSYQKAQKQTVGFNPTTGAALVGFDAIINPKAWVGGGAAYSYTHIHEKKDAGHSNINQEYLFVYGAYQGRHFYCDGALWGGLFQIDQVRKIHMTGFDFRSTSHPHGWQLSPHLELGYDYQRNNYVIVNPFVMADWVNAWQESYKEKGSGPFNAGQKRHYSSLLRTEVGLRFYETISFDSWRLTLEEKGSYVNKQSFHVGRVKAFLVGSPGTFTVETLTKAQNLGVAEFGMIFEPKDQKYPYGVITYQGEFGDRYQSHVATVELGWNF